MQKAIRLAAQGGLVRFPGGFWSFPDCPISHRTYMGQSERVPVEFVSVQTITACIARGFMIRQGDHFDDPVSLTPAGVDLAATLTAA